MKNILFISIAATLLTTTAIKVSQKHKDDDLDPETRDLYTGFLAKFHRNVKDHDEFKMRAKLFKKNKDMIDKFNKEESESAGYTMEENQFADLTDEEFSKFKGKKERDEIPSLS